MKNIIKLLGITAIVAVIGTVLAGCASMQLVSLEADTVDGPRQVRQGYDINPSAITVWGIYKDGNRKKVTVGIENIVFDKHTPGPQTVKIRVSGKETSFQTEVMPLRTLTIVSQPTVTFRQGQEADSAWTGLGIRGEWEQMGNDIIRLGYCRISGYNKDQAGQQTVTVLFEGLTATFNVEVRSLTSIQITRQPAKLDYTQGESLNLRNLRVMGEWEGLPSQEIAITEADVTGYNPQTIGRQTLTVTYGGKTATFSVEVVQSLNGTWVNITNGVETIYTFNNGNWTVAMNNPTVANVLNNQVLWQGTYTTSGGKITMTITHYNSASGAANNYGIPSKMYTQDELEAAIRASEKGKTMSEEEIRTAVGRSDGFTLMFVTTTNDYSFSGNTLTIGTVTYTKR